MTLQMDISSARASIPLGEPVLPFYHALLSVAAGTPIRQSLETARARQTICFAGDETDDVLFVLEGWAIKYHQLSNGKRQVLGVLMAGDIAAGVSVFQRKPHYSVQALTPVHYSKVKRQDILAHLIADPHLLAAFSALLVAERRELDEHLIDLGQRRADARIASLILRLHRRLEAHGEMPGLAFRCPLRQHHIADITGLTSVHVSRVLGVFRRHALLELSEGVVTILNLSELRKLGALR